MGSPPMKKKHPQNQFQQTVSHDTEDRKVPLGSLDQNNPVCVSPGSKIVATWQPEEQFDSGPSLNWASSEDATKKMPGLNCSKDFDI